MILNHSYRRYLRNRYGKSILFFLVSLLTLVFLFRRENRSAALDHLSEHDQITSLKSQIGYLRHQLARMGKKLQSETIVRDDAGLPMIYVITPTYARPVQKAELTRLCQVLLMVQNVHWIVIEDSRLKSDLVGSFLANCGVSYTHLNAQTPPDWKLKSDEKSWRKPRGVIQRNEGLHWVRANAIANSNGVIYFADDDNTYSLELFDEMRFTKTVSVWPVGLVGGLMVEKPKVDPVSEKVIGWDVVWAPNRPFAIDMAGFAVNLKLFLSRPKAKFAYEVKRGHQESVFLKELVSDLSELEPKAGQCTKVLVWHTRTEKVRLDMEKKLSDQLQPPSNLHIEV